MTDETYGQGEARWFTATRLSGFGSNFELTSYLLHRLCHHAGILKPDCTLCMNDESIACEIDTAH
jgi:hypothetical protein